MKMMQENATDAEADEKPLGKEGLAQMQTILNDMYMKMLDEPVPMWGDRTPREMTKTKGGKDEVRDWIRTMPDPMGGSSYEQGKIRVPRKEMMKALGLI